MKFKAIYLAIVCFILIFVPLVFAEENSLFFSIILNYNSGTISLNDVKLIEGIGEIDKNSTDGDYKLTVYSFNEELLYESNFDLDLELFNSPPQEWFDDEGNQIYVPSENETELAKIETTSKVLFIPYFPNANQLVIEKESKVELIIDLSEFALCNQNKICDTEESQDLCPVDCLITDVTYEKISFWQRLIGWIKSLI